MKNMNVYISTAANTSAATGGGNNLTAGCSESDTLNHFCSTSTPRRMFLCDVPLFINHINAKNNNDGGNDDRNFVRLMGTVVEILQTSSAGSDNNNMMMSKNNVASSTPNNNQTRMVHFVIDDGTGSIGVFTNRRVRNNSHDENTNGDSSGNGLPTTTMQTQISQNANQNQYLQPSANNQFRPAAATSLESILSSPQRPILVGQIVDCIGRIHIDNDIVSVAAAVENTSENDDDTGTETISVQTQTNNDGMLWLAASSVSIMDNPQAMTLRLMELSSSDRNMNIYGKNSNMSRDRGTNNIGSSRVNNAQNRILVGGHLERKLNPLYHHNNSVLFNMEHAFDYIKHSKDDGGITVKELTSLVGAVEPNEVLAVNLAVEQLREDCRIYLNQGKWFPM